MKVLLTIRVKHVVIINQDGLNPCNIIIFQEVNTVSSEEPCHCTCMAGMGETCNHAVAAMYRVEAAVRIGLTHPACTSNPNECLPNRKSIKTKKMKDLDFSWEDFGHKGQTISNY